MNLQHFDISEFDSPDLPGSGERMQEGTLIMLDEARDIAKVPFKINSGYRTKEHNCDIGGSETSSHMGGWAIDIHCNNGASRMRIMVGLVMAGFRRIGIAATFIHVDNDPSKNPSIWLY